MEFVEFSEDDGEEEPKERVVGLRPVLSKRTCSYTFLHYYYIKG